MDLVHLELLSPASSTQPTRLVKPQVLQGANSLSPARAPVILAHLRRVTPLWRTDLSITTGSIRLVRIHSSDIKRKEMASGSVVIWVLIAAVLAGSGGYVATPKGPNQVLIRTSLLLTLACCYLMWFIIFMAQLNPIIHPKRADIRFD